MNVPLRSRRDLVLMFCRYPSLNEQETHEIDRIIAELLFEYAQSKI